MSDIGQIIKGKHRKGSKGMLDILRGHKTFNKWPVCLSVLIAACPSIIIGILAHQSSFKILSITCDLVLSVFPSLLGFSLAGYAIIIGYSNIDLLKASTNKDAHSPYQILSAIFGFSILLQVITTLVDFLFTFLIRININNTFSIPNYVFGDFINIILFFVIMFLSVYSLLLTTYLVNNLFTMGQANSLYLTGKKIKEDALKGEETNEERQTKILSQILEKISK